MDFIMLLVTNEVKFQLMLRQLTILGQQCDITVKIEKAKC